MSLAFSSCNMTAVDLQSLPFNGERRYLSVIATTEVEITIAGGTPFIIAAGSNWSPIPAPMNAISFTGSGTMVTG